MSDSNPVPCPIPATPAPFDAAQQAALDLLMDLMIPASRDGRMPSARSLRLYADAATLPARARALFDAGLADLDRLAEGRHGVPFGRLDRADAIALVEPLRAARSAFIDAFMTHTVGRYVAHEAVLPLIGLPVRPHWPEGHAVAQGDWSLIEVVRQRGKIYRPV